MLNFFEAVLAYEKVSRADVKGFMLKFIEAAEAL